MGRRRQDASHSSERKKGEKEGWILFNHIGGGGHEDERHLYAEKKGRAPHFCLGGEKEERAGDVTQRKKKKQEAEGPHILSRKKKGVVDSLRKREKKGRASNSQGRREAGNGGGSLAERELLPI